MRDQVEREWRDKGFRARVVPYIEDMATEMSRAHLVISRAGGSTLAELMAVGRGGFFFPYQGHSDRHQILNARYLAEKGAGVVADPNDAPRDLARSLEPLLEKARLEILAEHSRECGRPAAAFSIREMIRIHLDARDSRRFSDRSPRDREVSEKVEI